MEKAVPTLPQAPSSIQAGMSLGEVLGPTAIECLARNIHLVHRPFDRKAFQLTALQGLDELGIMARGVHIAKAVRPFLPSRFDEAVKVLTTSLTPPLTQTEGNGLAVFFYHPHACYVAEFGLDAKHNAGQDPFEASMFALYEITRRFTAEFAIRPFLIQQQKRTLQKLFSWTNDADPHVRRLCSEGTRPRLPWGKRIPAFIADPSPALPILEKLKNDSALYVRRSVANHLGDIAKDHPELVVELCTTWSKGASPELKWLIRHALRYPAKKGNPAAIKLRSALRD